MKRSKATAGIAIGIVACLIAASATAATASHRRKAQDAKACVSRDGALRLRRHGGCPSKTDPIALGKRGRQGPAGIGRVFIAAEADDPLKLPPGKYYLVNKLPLPAGKYLVDTLVTVSDPVGANGLSVLCRVDSSRDQGRSVSAGSATINTPGSYVTVPFDFVGYAAGPTKLTLRCEGSGDSYVVGGRIVTTRVSSVHVTYLAPNG